MTVLELLSLALVHDGVAMPLTASRGQPRGIRNGMQLAVDPDDRRQAGLDMDIGALRLYRYGQNFVQFYAVTLL